jgi:phage major head subunit gpT-like protein
VDINASSLAAIATGFSTKFSEALPAALGADRLEQIATVVPVTTSPIEFPVLALTADMR